jgi:hypothetical protein
VRDRVGPGATGLCLLLLLGALHWAFFLDSAQQPGLGPSPVQDWPKEFRYYAVLRQAVTEARVPYFLSTPIVFSRKFLAIPEVSWSPQVVLLRFLSIPTFIVVNTLLAFGAGASALLLLKSRYRLGPLPFAFLFLLFAFNGHITSHLAIGHSMWLGYFLLPFFVLGVLTAAERPATPLLAEKLALVLFLILLQGSFHIFVWCVLFLLLLLAFNPGHWRLLLRALAWTGALTCCRLLPAAFVAQRREQVFLTGFPTLRDVAHALLTVRDAAYGKRGGSFGAVDWWEYDTYLGPAGVAWIVACGFGLAWKGTAALADRAERRLYGPMAVMALLAFGDAALGLNLIGIPLLSSQRVASRLLILPICFLIVLAAVRMQRFFETRSSRAMTVLATAAALATAAGLLLHSWSWRFAHVERLLPVKRAVGEVSIVDPRLLPMGAADHLYVATVRGSVAFSVAALLLLGWRLLRQKRENASA